MEYYRFSSTWNSSLWNDTNSFATDIDDNANTNDSQQIDIRQNKRTRSSKSKNDSKTNKPQPEHKLLATKSKLSDPNPVYHPVKDVINGSCSDDGQIKFLILFEDKSTKWLSQDACNHALNLYISDKIKQKKLFVKRVPNLRGRS